MSVYIFLMQIENSAVPYVIVLYCIVLGWIGLDWIGLHWIDLHLIGLHRGMTAQCNT